MIVTGDFNIDLLNGDEITVNKYKDILNSYDLIQHITKPTRKNKTLIDHISTNLPYKVSEGNILPCDVISDHDAPYIVINIKKQRFESRYKYVRDEKKLVMDKYITDFQSLPLSIIYSFDNPEDQIDILNDLIKSCIDLHAPLKKNKFTRPPAPWMRSNTITFYQSELVKTRLNAQTTNLPEHWNLYRSTRGKLKSIIRSEKRNFYAKALSSKKSKDVWNVIHRILKPCPKRINTDPNVLNSHFANTATRLTGLTMDSNIITKNNSKSIENSFSLYHTTYNEVLKCIKSLRNDCSTGI